MHDIRFIRDNPMEFDKFMQRRGLNNPSLELLSLDEKRRKIQTELQSLQAKRNELSKKIGGMKAAGVDVDDLMSEVASIKLEIPELEHEESNLAEQINSLLFSSIPEKGSSSNHTLLLKK